MMIVTTHALLRYALRFPATTAGKSLDDMRTEIIRLATTTAPYWIVVENGCVVTILEPGMRPMKAAKVAKLRAKRSKMALGRVEIT